MRTNATLCSKIYTTSLFVLILFFNTILSAQTNLLTQGFEALPFPPTGWSNVRITGPSFPGNWARYGNGLYPAQSPHTGLWQVRYNSHNFGAGTSGDLRTSVLDFTVSGTYTASFWMYRDNWFAGDKMEVFVNTTQTSVGGTLLGTINRDRNQSPTEPTNGWYQYTFSVPPAFNTATNYIIFKGTSAFGNDIYIDDISIDRLAPAAPGCITSYTPLTGTTGTCLNETLTWDIVALASGYKISVGSNAPDYNNVANNSDLGVAINYVSLLNPTTLYGWKITPYNGFGDATGCPTNTFTTGTGVCYCTPVYLDGSCGTEDFIDDFSTTLGTTNITNNNTGCTTNPNNYTFFSAQTVTVTQGNAFNVSMQSGPDYAEGYAIWIDLNIDGDFLDAGEFVYNSAIATTAIVNGTINIPLTATAGTTRMRVRCAYNYVPTASQSCTTFNEGETEDYKITIVACAASTYYADIDGDTYGNIAASTLACGGAPAGYVVNSTDCNDSNAGINPGAAEVCNSIDDNCNASIDEGLIFVTYYQDADTDGYGNAATTQTTCSGAPINYVANSTDCNDANAAINPGTSEICNGIDDNCNASIDDGLTFITYYADADGDTFGNSASSQSTCSGPPTGYVTSSTDCNDMNSAIKPGAIEICNSIDDDCDVSIDEGVATATITPSGPTTFCSTSNVILQANTGAGFTYQWIKNGANIGGAAGIASSYTTNKQGNYQVKVTVPGGCFATSANTTVTVLATPKATISTPDGTDLCGLANVRLKANTGVSYTYIWYKNNVVIAGATSNTYFATTIGNYKVRVTGPTGCFKTSPITVVTALCKLEGELMDGELSIYPNPANDKVNIHLQLFETGNNSSIINIFDITGKLILAETAPIDNGELVKEINISNWSAGIYLVKVESNNVVYTKQLIVNK